MHIPIYCFSMSHTNYTFNGLITNTNNMYDKIRVSRFREAIRSGCGFKSHGLNISERQTSCVTDTQNSPENSISKLWWHMDFLLVLKQWPSELCDIRCLSDSIIIRNQNMCFIFFVSKFRQAFTNCNTRALLKWISKIFVWQWLNSLHTIILWDMSNPIISLNRE